MDVRRRVCRRVKRWRRRYANISMDVRVPYRSEAVATVSSSVILRMMIALIIDL